MMGISRSFGELAEARAELAQRNVDRARYALDDELDRLAHVEQERAFGLVPVGERHVAAQDVGGDHPGEVDRVLRAAELGRVAELGLLEVVDRRAHLDGHRQGADPLVHRRTVLAERLRPEEAAIGFAEEDLHPEHLGARIVSGVGVREEVDLLVVLSPSLLSVFSLTPVQAAAPPNSPMIEVPWVPR